MCYPKFNDIIQDIADLDADLIFTECSRSPMELLEAFSDPNGIRPAIYDIYSRRVPSKQIDQLLEKAKSTLLLFFDLYGEIVTVPVEKPNLVGPLADENE